MKSGFVTDEQSEPRKILQELVETVEACGGIRYDQCGLPCPAGDMTWIDLGYVYLDACKFLGVEPLEEARDE